MMPATDGIGQPRQEQSRCAQAHDQPHSRDAEDRTSHALARVETTDAVVTLCRYSTSLAQLATDEVRLIMQCLDRQSLCCLARCCRRMFADADSPVAWRTQPLLYVPLLGGKWFEAKQQQMLLPSLLAHAPKHATLDNTDGELATLVTIPRLVSLMLTHHHPFSPQQWQLLQESACRETVTRLSLMPRDEYSDRSLMDLLEIFSAVTDLAVNSYEQPFLPDRDASAAAAGRLRRLYVSDDIYSEEPSKFILSILLCTSLTYLTILRPTIAGQAFVDFFANPAMANLQVLRLEVLWPTPLGVDYRPAFAALRHLRSLTVELIYPRSETSESGESFDLLFAAMAAAPALEYIGIDITQNYSAPRPSPPVLVQLLADAPKLHISLLHAETISDAAQVALAAVTHPRLNVRASPGGSSKVFFIDEAGFLDWPR